MPIYITNNWIKIPKDTSCYLPIKSNLTFYEHDKTIHSKGREFKIKGKVNKLYSVGSDDTLFVPVGLYGLLQEYLTLDVEVVDNRMVQNKNLLNTDFYIVNMYEFDDILPGITLYKEQLMCIRKILYAKRGIINAATGFGKSAVMAGTIKILTMMNKDLCPTVVILEPTIKLVNDMVSSFKSYGIDAVAYSKSRKIEKNKVNIVHPKSLGNDLEKNSDLLNDVEVMFGDETHHFACDTWKVPTYDMPNLVYSVGVSASAICQEHVKNSRLLQYTYEELSVIGATGNLLMNITADYLIRNGILAKPILFRINHKAEENLDELEEKDWQLVNTIRLQSKERNKKVCRTAKIFSENNRKTLILVRTVEWARELLKLFSVYGLGNKVFASYGYGKFETYDFATDEYLSLKEDYFGKFNSGDYNIVIGTTHMYEGVDIKELDVIVLAWGGRSERIQIQGCGRALRKSKTGKFAYIVDFTDTGDYFLTRQSSTRMNRYIKTIGIPKDHIFDGIEVSQVEKTFKSLEM